MGMFDYIRCEMPLPDGFTGELQTKDLDCEMDVYLIRADGTLAILKFDLELLPQEQWDHPDPDDPLHPFGRHRRVNERYNAVDYHGMLNFYGGQGDYWHEYLSKFTDGRLVEVRQL